MLLFCRAFATLTFQISWTNERKKWRHNHPNKNYQIVIQSLRTCSCVEERWRKMFFFIETVTLIKSYNNIIWCNSYAINRELRFEPVAHYFFFSCFCFLILILILVSMSLWVNWFGWHYSMGRVINVCAQIYRLLTLLCIA